MKHNRFLPQIPPFVHPSPLLGIKRRRVWEFFHVHREQGFLLNPVISCSMAICDGCIVRMRRINRALVGRMIKGPNTAAILFDYLFGFYAVRSLRIHEEEEEAINASGSTEETKLAFHQKSRSFPSSFLRFLLEEGKVGLHHWVDEGWWWRDSCWMSGRWIGKSNVACETFCHRTQCVSK